MGNMRYIPNYRGESATCGSCDVEVPYLEDLEVCAVEWPQDAIEAVDEHIKSWPDRHL